MSKQTQNETVKVRGHSYKKQIILEDAQIPYKLSIDRETNNLFFCINADQFSDQSFHSVVLNLDSGFTSIIPGIRNGFASAVDQDTSTVYLGGSEGIFTYSYDTRDVEKPALVKGVDIFDMFFFKHLYFVDTANQNLHIYNNNRSKQVTQVETSLIKYFAINGRDELFFLSAMGLFMQPFKSKSPILLDNYDINFRGATTDVYGTPHFVAQDGIYLIDEQSKQLVRILTLENGYGLAFDKDNNIVYSDERTVTKLIPSERIPR